MLQVLTDEPDLTGWYLVVCAMTPALHRPADQAVPETTPVQHSAVGAVQGRAQETELAGGLNRTSVAYLAGIVDHACPPA